VGEVPNEQRAHQQCRPGDDHGIARVEAGVEVETGDVVVAAGRARAPVMLCSHRAPCGRQGHAHEGATAADEEHDEQEVAEDLREQLIRRRW
jgi:hypothetical protein